MENTNIENIEFNLVEEPVEEVTPAPTPAPTPSVRKSSRKKAKPCTNCPDYSKEDLYREKILQFKTQGYNSNQIASMLGIHKQFVDGIK